MALIGNLIEPNDIIYQGPTGGFWEWVGLAGLALAASITILSFLYMWAALFRNSQLNAYVKQELYEVVVSAVLVLFLFTAVGAMSGLKVSSFFPDELLPSDVDSTTTIYEATAKYYERLDTDMAGWLNMNYVINVYIDQIASVTPYARPLGVGLVASPMAGIAAPIKQLLYNMSVALSVAFIINYAQLAVYVFSLQAFMKYYLPLGIFLRCFTPTRKLGGTLIGVGIAFLFIFPALTTITYSMFYSRSSGPLVSFNNMIWNYVDDNLGSGGGAFATFYDDNFTGSSSSLIDMISGAFGAIGMFLTNLFGGILLTLLLFPISTISIAFAVGFIMPTFNIMVFTQAARGLSKSFGEEVDITSLTRMI
ncbi:hypothetical protein KKB44_06450 [Candidatus Micrarchaeota archaeon]|nr:hypothetical protein [Candidatus Micrarchaeota archaeon]